MIAPVKLAAFAAAVAVAFGLGYGAGDLAGPFGDDADDAPVSHDEHETGEQ